MAGIRRTGGTSFDSSTGIVSLDAPIDVGSMPVSRNISPAEHMPQNSLEALFGSQTMGQQIERMLAPTIHDRALLQADNFPRQFLSALQFLMQRKKKKKGKDGDLTEDDGGAEDEAAALQELYDEFLQNRELYKTLSGLLIAG